MANGVEKVKRRVTVLSKYTHIGKLWCTFAFLLMRMNAKSGHRRHCSKKKKNVLVASIDRDKAHVS